MVTSICKEIELKRGYLNHQKIESVYFGGGTPSVLAVQEIDSILSALKKHFDFNTKIEITLEVNPDDVNSQKLTEWLALGINRLSIGLQSFNDDELNWMKRAHDSQQSISSVKLAQDKGLSNITIDLIYGSKFQSQKSWEQTLLKAIALNTQHVSSYNLTIEKKTELGHKYEKGTEPPVNDELSSAQFLLMIDALSDADFIHYEISNFGKDGFFAIHNSNYWLGKHYLGLGPSAHSYNGATRSWNISNNNQYIASVKNGIPFTQTEELLLNDRYNEYVLTRLRTIWGCDVNEIESLFGKDVRDQFLKQIQVKQNFIQKSGSNYTLNRNGKLQADGIAASLFL